MIQQQIISKHTFENIFNAVLSITKREFTGPVEQLFSSYFLYFTHCWIHHHLFTGFNILICFMITYLALKTFKYFFNSFLLSFLFLHVLFFVISTIAFVNFENNILNIFFITLLVNFLYANAWWSISFVISAFFVSNNLAIVFLVYFIVIKFKNIYSQLINHKIPLSVPLKTFIKSILQLLIIPLFFYFGFACLDIATRNKWCEFSNKLSFEYQSNLSGFDAHSKISPDLTPNKSEKFLFSKSNKYVMDRSIVSILNIRHRGFITIPYQNTVGENNDFNYLEIIKIYNENFNDEEPRFIKNGDIVRLKFLNNEKYIGFKEPKVVLQNQKLLNLSFEQFEDQNDFWKVECLDYLSARDQIVKFFHVNKEMYMGCNVANSELVLHISAYSNHKSREFYIVDSYNHDYFIKNFENDRARATVTNFPLYSFRNKLFEYVTNIKNTETHFFDGIYNFFWKDTKFSFEIAIKLLVISQFILSLIISLWFLFLYVLKHRYSLCKLPNNHVYNCCYIFICSLIGSLCFSSQIDICFYTSILFNFSFLVSLYK